MSDWFITKDIVDIKDDASEGILFNIFYLIKVYYIFLTLIYIYLTLSSYLSKVYSPDDRISNILLKKCILQKNIETSLLLNIQAELKLAYQDLGDNSAIFNSAMTFFGYASFLFEKENGDTVLCRLHIGDVVSINIEDGENFAIVRAILCHQKNDVRLAFIIVDWFEEANRKILGCPVFKLIRRPKNNWRRVFSINLVDAINTTHFVHSCSGECDGDDHDSRNNSYIRNLYFFKAV